MKYNITGDNLRFANIEIAPGEMVYAEAGSMAYMTSNVSMDAKMRGGLFKGLKRKLTGESFFLTTSARREDWRWSLSPEEFRGR